MTRHDSHQNNGEYANHHDHIDRQTGSIGFEIVQPHTWQGVRRADDPVLDVRAKAVVEVEQLVFDVAPRIGKPFWQSDSKQAQQHLITRV